MWAQSSDSVNLAKISYFYSLCLKEATQTVFVSGPQCLNLNLTLVPRDCGLGFVGLANDPPHRTVCPKDPVRASSLFVQGKAQPRAAPRAPLSSTPTSCPVAKKESPGKVDRLQKHRALTVFWPFLRKRRNMVLSTRVGFAGLGRHALTHVKPESYGISTGEPAPTQDKHNPG